MLEKIYKNLVSFILLGVVVVLLITFFQIKKDNQHLQEQVIAYQKEIIQLDTLRKISDGNYSKLVDIFKTEKDLMSDLKKSYIEVYNHVKSNNEKLLALNQYFISFKNKLDSGIATLKDSNSYEMKLFYPDQSDWFVNWNGIISKNTGNYNGAWNFGQLKFGVTLTQQTNGLFKSYITGPKFLMLDSIKVESLPPVIPLKERNLEFLLGGGYRFNIDQTKKAFVIGAGFQWKNSNMLLLDVGSDNNVTGKFVYKFRSFKKN